MQLRATCYALKIVFAPHPHFGYISSYITQQRAERNSLGLIFTFMKTEQDGQLLSVHFQHLSSVLLGSLLNPFMCRRWSMLYTQRTLCILHWWWQLFLSCTFVIYFQDACSFLWVFCNTLFIMGEPISSFLSDFSKKAIHQSKLGTLNQTAVWQRNAQCEGGESSWLMTVVVWLHWYGLEYFKKACMH